MRALALILMLTVGCATTPKSEYFAMGCAAADLVTTAYALDQGATEANPLAVDGYEVASLALFSVLTHLGLRHLSKRKYHNPGKAAPWWLGVGSYRCTLAAWNLSEVNE